MIQEPWLITIDLDGTTLTSNSKGISFDIPEMNIDILRKAVAEGHKIAVVTGRPWRDTKPIYHELGLDTIVANYNGAHIHKPGDDGFIPFKSTMNRFLLDDLNETLFESFFDNFIIEDDHETLVYNMKDEDMLIKFHVKEGKNLRSLSNKDKLILNPYSAVYRIKDGINVDDAMTKLKRKYGHAMNMRIWALGEVNFIELNSKAIHKGAAMINIAAYYNIPMHRTLALGDGVNDLEMLEQAAIGVAMKNASSIVKSYANDVTKYSNDEAGVGHYIKNWLENKK